MGQFSTKNIFHLIRFEHFIHSTKFNQFESRPSNKKVGASLTFDNISCVCVSNDYVSVDDDIHVLRSVLAGTKTENQQLGRGVGRGQDRAHERKKNAVKCFYVNDTTSPSPFHFTITFLQVFIVKSTCSPPDYLLLQIASNIINMTSKLKHIQRPWQG